MAETGRNTWVEAQNTHVASFCPKLRQLQARGNSQGFAAKGDLKTRCDHRITCHRSPRKSSVHSVLAPTVVVWPGAPSSFLLLVAMPFAPSSVLAKVVSVSPHFQTHGHPTDLYIFDGDGDIVDEPARTWLSVALALQLNSDMFGYGYYGMDALVRGSGARLPNKRPRNLRETPRRATGHPNLPSQRERERGF